MSGDAALGPEIWGGIECTLNRVGDRPRSQLRLSGHLERIETDLDAFAGLGLSALRYPVLWDQVEDPAGSHDFDDADRALDHLREGPMRPIVGLLHHGSGPVSTSLIDPRMPERLADFAAVTARRYPWVEDYTPVNEPLTTARFAGLYGFWYPHLRNDHAFVRMLLAQVRGTVLAMRAIREVTPQARLVQTEDLGQAGGTPPLTTQVAFENERRWLSFDLLCGRVTPDHALYDYLTVTAGTDADELRWFVDNPCRPDVVGINHYPRSNRWLDHRLDLFDPPSHGGNGRVPYADVAAIDYPLVTVTPLSTLMDQPHQRYRLPIALTEVHVHGDDEARIAWWHHGLRAAETAASAGADVAAVTAWSLLGSFDWDTLCTSAHDSAPRDLTYEQGVFDVSSGRMIETALAAALRQTTGTRRASAEVSG